MSDKCWLKHQAIDPREADLTVTHYHIAYIKRTIHRGVKLHHSTNID